MTEKKLNPWDERDRLKLGKLAQKKKIERAKNPTKQEVKYSKGMNRLPPGQNLTAQFPVLDLGTQPNLSTQDWSLTITGQVEHPCTLEWKDFQELRQSQTTSDIHCVTDWSRYDNQWAGVLTQDLAHFVGLRDSVKYVLLKSYDGYSTNLPIKDFLQANCLIATHWEGKPLTREHGGPARLVFPHLYFWKSAKWIRQIAFRTDELKGFWEVRGYHNYGDPWKNQRFD